MSSIAAMPAEIDGRPPVAAYLGGEQPHPVWFLVTADDNGTHAVFKSVGPRVHPILTGVTARAAHQAAQAWAAIEQVLLAAPARAT